MEEDEELNARLEVDITDQEMRLNINEKFDHLLWLRNRELGIKPKLGTTSKLSNQIYRNMNFVTDGDRNKPSTNTHPWAGGIFNLEFSPDGSSLIAACSKNSFMVFDPFNRKCIHSVDKAHSDSVNCVNFLDDHIFATGSDDCTVALWDLRNLGRKMKSLAGHSNWVKNVDFSKKDNSLVTSGFDGSVFVWDLSCETDTGLLYKRVFQNNGLMRMTLAPDASKMIICTTGGYIMIVHDLDLVTLDSDLHGFQPNVYRLMQISEQVVPSALRFNHLFRSTRKYNRVEFITDFPETDNAEVISSLQVHPQGWCIVSRNGSTDESSEWTCVHDIQEMESPMVEDDEMGDPDVFDQENVTIGTARIRILRPMRRRVSRRTLARAARNNSSRTVPSFDIWEAILRIDAPGGRSPMLYAVGRNETAGFRVQRMASGISSQVEDEIEIDDTPSQEEEGNGNGNLPRFSRSDLTPGLISSSAARAIISQVNSFTFGSPTNTRGFSTNSIYRNRPRLSHFIEEPNAGKGFIKETSFSYDGRIIASPFARGVRLLAFSKGCEELSKCFPKKPKNLEEIAVNFAHKKMVLCTKFSPTHHLLVSGCLGGHISWYQPAL